jgi:hypothetical protein
MFKVAVLEPEAAGVKVKRMVHEPEAATLPAFAHVPPDRAKSEALAPVIVKKGVDRDWLAVPVFERVSGELVELTF